MMRPALLFLTLAACGGDGLSKGVHWVHFEPLDLPNLPVRDLPSPRMFCGDDTFVTRVGTEIVDYESGTITALPDVPNDPKTGQIGAVTCAGTTLFTAPPDTGRAFRAEAFGTWEELRTGSTVTVISDILAASNGDVYRAIIAIDDSALPLLQRSTDGGLTWSDLIASMVVPTGGDATSVELIGAEGFLEYAVIGDSGEGVIRSDLDGGGPLVAETFVKDFESPSPVWQRGVNLLATQAYSEDSSHPAFAFERYWITDQPAKELSVFDWQPALISGLFDPSGANVGSPFQVAVDGEERLVISFADRLWRSDRPWFDTARVSVVQHPSCEVLEREGGAVGLDGPSELTLTHSGGEPFLVGTIGGTDGIRWLNDTILIDDKYAYDLIETGEQLAVRSQGAPVLIADSQGRCVRVLDDNDDGEVDLGSL